MITKEFVKQLKREVLTDSYHEFFKFAFKILMPSEQYVDTPHIKYLCDLLQEEVLRIERNEEKTDDIIINIPPRTSKSLIVSVALNAWVWIRMPQIPFICVSFDAKLTNKNSSDCRDIIKSDEYQDLFGDIFKIRADSDGKEMFSTDKGGFRISTTTGSNITGFKGAIIIVDDPQNPLTSESTAMREKVINYWNGSLYNRLTPERLGVRILIQQRLHQEDLTGYLLKENPDAYRHICLPAEVSDLIKPRELSSLYKDGYLDPVRLGIKTLTSFRKTLGARGYAGQYDQTPSPDTGGIINRLWFDVVDPSSIIRDLTNEPIHFFIDPAYTEKTENDPTAILACFKQNNVLYILDVVEKWLGLPELCAFIQIYVKQYGYSHNSKIWVEPKASGISIVQTLRSSSMLNIIEGKSPKDDKVTRAHSITPILETRRVRLVNGTYMSNYLDQLVLFPNGKHDDMVDTTVMAVTELLISSGPDFFFL